MPSCHLKRERPPRRDERPVALHGRPADAKRSPAEGTGTKSPPALTFRTTPEDAAFLPPLSLADSWGSSQASRGASSATTSSSGWRLP